MFGRVDICDFVLEHPTISRFHAGIVSLPALSTAITLNSLFFYCFLGTVYGSNKPFEASDDFFWVKYVANSLVYS